MTLPTDLDRLVAEAAYCGREPSPDELREASLQWISHIGPTLIDQWPVDVLALSMPTKFVRLPTGIIGDLFEHPGGIIAASIRELATELDALLDWERHFIRLNSRSPKDAPWPFEVPVTCSGKEAMMVLGCSERVLDDMVCFEYVPEHPAYICARQFIPGLRPDGEFRCFVKDGELIAVSAYDYLRPARGPDDGGRVIRDKIDRWFADVLKPRLHLDTVVFDVFIGWNGSIVLIELNPYGLSDPCFLGSYRNVETFVGAIAFADPDGEERVHAQAEGEEPVLTTKDEAVVYRLWKGA